MTNLSDTPETGTGNKKKHGCLRLLAAGVLLVLVLLVALHFLAPGIATRVANRQLPVRLGTNSSLDGVSLNLISGRAGVRGLRIDQPEGFEGDPLLTLDEASLRAPVLKVLSADPVVVDRIAISGLNLNLVSDTNQVVNVTKLGPETPKEEKEGKPAAPPSVWIRKVLLEQVRITFRDTQTDWDIEMADIQFELRDLRIEQPSPDGPAIADGRLTFHSPRADGLVKLRAKIGTLVPSKPETLPPMQIALGIVGFDLDLVRPFLRPSPALAKQALGGNGFDLLLFIRINPGDSPDIQLIDGRFELITDAGQKLGGPVGGTLEKPVFPFLNVFTDILGNQFGRVTRLGGNLFEGGYEAGETAVKTGGALVKGAACTAAGLAGGVLKTAKGVVTLDAGGALGGAKEATLGTVGKAADTVADTLGTAGEGVKKTTKRVFGGDEVEKWWSGVPERMEDFEEKARAWFDDHPFPKA